MIQLNRLDPPYYEGKVAIFESEVLDGEWIFWSGILRMYYLVLGDFEGLHLLRESEDLSDAT